MSCEERSELEGLEEREGTRSEENAEEPEEGGGTRRKRREERGVGRGEAANVERARCLTTEAPKHRVSKEKKGTGGGEAERGGRGGEGRDREARKREKSGGEEKLVSEEGIGTEYGPTEERA